MKLESKNLKLESDNSNLKRDINILKQENINIKQDILRLKQDKIDMIYRQIITEIYNIAIQKIMGWTSKQRQRNNINGFKDFKTYIDDSEWNKYSDLLDNMLINMGITDELFNYIKIIERVLMS